MADPVSDYSPAIAALVRAGRVLVAAAISAVIVALPQAVDLFHLDPAYTAALITAGTAVLNALGKFFRDTQDATTVV